MKLFGIRNAIVKSAAISLIVVGGAAVANAQNVNSEYREWQQAQREAQREYNQYLMTGSQRDYRQWQRAQREAQREQLEYQRAANMYGRGTGYGYGRANINRGRMYRVYRNGSYHEMDQRGAELLRQAVNSGYQQGYRQGQMDRRYGRGSGYYGNDVYMNGTYGHQSYIARDQYQYYFQQGFQRGYEDGYNSTSRYGYRSGSSFNILGTVLNTILNLSQQ